ncbi:hypothetical protein GE061_002809 [Apolygus lucorum]|uniref:Gustatory receptor n=1 Tax=Apolygus lucorum TaxID=248454 RepID=A0A8S9X7Z2_APOLU|nr:hypothetical protein GE061_002809 [Apolygus lucorum]
MSEPTQVEGLTPYSSISIDLQKTLVKRHMMNPTCQTTRDFISIEKDLESEQGFLSESIFYKMSRPIMWMERFLGQSGYRIESGWMRYSHNSFPFAYIVFVAVFQVAMTILNWEHLMSAVDKLSQPANYDSILLSCLMLAQVPGFLIGIYSWFFEVPLVVKCYNVTATIEKRILDVFPTSSLSKRATYFWTAVIVLDLLVILVFGSFIIYGSDLYTYSIAIPFMFNFTRCHLACLHSCYCLTFCRDLAHELKDSMVKMMQNSEYHHHKLKICQQFWLEIWNVLQDHANSLAITLLVQMVNNLMFFVTSCYGMIVLIKADNFSEMLLLLPYLGIAVFNMGLICEPAQQAQDELGSFLWTLMGLKKQSLCQKSIEELDDFMKTISLTEKSTITLKNYISIGRPLLVAFSSTSVTYLIVLLQFPSVDNELQKTSNYTTAF